MKFSRRARGWGVGTVILLVALTLSACAQQIRDWRDGADERIVMLTGHAFMIALDAKTGRPIESFGDKGTVDLSQDLGRPIVAR
jgi:glucose dehydrogenase